MTILFSPNGSLNVAQDASELPEIADGNNISSGALRRCKNLRINQQGLAKTRDGSAKINATALETDVWWVEVQAGVRYTFAGTVIYQDEIALATGLTSAQWAAIQYTAFNDTTQHVFALNGTDRKRIETDLVREWGIDAPTVAPTLGIGAGSTLTGEYNAKYTYVRKVGETVVAESNPSPEATLSAVLSGQSLSVEVTQPSDPQVTHIRLYRTGAGGAAFYYVDEIAIGLTYVYGYSHEWESTDAYVAGSGFLFTISDATHVSDNTFSWEERFSNLTTSITDTTYAAPFDDFDSNIADGSLVDLVEEDHDRPPLGSFVFGPAYDGTVFILKDNLLYYCKPKQPEYWPGTYFIEVSTPQFPLKTGVFHNGQAHVFTANEIFYVQGTGHGAFFALPMRAKTGAQSLYGAVSVAGRGIYHTGPDGIYLYTSGSDDKVTEDSLEPIFRGESVEGLPGVLDLSTSMLWVFRNHLYFAYASEVGYAYPTNVLVLNLQTNRISYYTFNDGALIEIRAVAIDYTNKRLLIGDNAGYVREIEGAANTDDSGTAITWEVQSKDFMLQTRKHFPRWCKYDVDASAATTCTGALILDGAIHHSHTITGARDTRRRLVDEGNGNRAAIRISGTGAVSIYAAEGE
jgi:hypothetical protein